MEPKLHPSKFGKTVKKVIFTAFVPISGLAKKFTLEVAKNMHFKR